MSFWNRLRDWIKERWPKKPRNEERFVALAAPPAPSPAGWWREDSVEQLRHYQSWVYAAVNAIAQEVAMQRPFLYLNSGQAEHEQTPLAHDHPLTRLLDEPNPWTTPWELWYLTTVYLELTGKSFLHSGMAGKQGLDGFFRRRAALCWGCCPGRCRARPRDRNAEQRGHCFRRRPVVS